MWWCVPGSEVVAPTPVTVWECESVTVRVWQCDSVRVWRCHSVRVWRCECDSVTVCQCKSVTRSDLFSWCSHSPAVNHNCQLLRLSISHRGRRGKTGEINDVKTQQKVTKYFSNLIPIFILFLHTQRGREQLIYSRKSQSFMTFFGKNFQKIYFFRIKFWWTFKCRNLESYESP